MVFCWPAGAALRPLLTMAGQRLVLLVLLLGLGTTAGSAQGRVTQRLNTSWQFRKDAERSLTPTNMPASSWETVNLPHTWNAHDVLDDAPGYYRGAGWYRRQLHLPADWAQRRLYLHFEGANQETEVYLNGRLAGRHAGGYTAFRVPLNEVLTATGTAKTGTAELLVKVDNRHNPAIPPLSADFTFYGGLYRDVYLVAAQPVHFDLDDHASPGVFVTTPQVSAEAATVQLRGAVTNDAPTARTVRLRHRLLDAAGQPVSEQTGKLRLNAGQRLSFQAAFKPLRQPHLWSPDAPYLYRVVSEVLGEDNQPLDAVTIPVGLRWFRFDTAEGFFLNGQPLKLIGTNRHQDFPGLGNALPDALHERDVQLIKQMGGNFLRVSHYPQDPTVLQACDRLGILASVEIPVVNAITESEDFYRNCETMQTEMIRQSYNHPSVIIWAYMNEVLLRLPAGLKKDSDAGRAYLQNVARLAQRLDDLSRREDPARATMLVCHGAFELYRDAGLLRIPTVVGWNLYPGWYSPRLEDFPAFLDRHRRELPDKPLLVTEYGADSDTRLHSLRPQRFDKTAEYANRYHEYYLREMLRRPFVAGSAVWNLAEFNSESRQEAVPHVNNKSLLTGDRQPKDAYLFYQANLLKTPFLAIGARGWRLRAGVAGPDSLVCVQPVEVHTNQPAVELRLNGRLLGTRPAEFGVARFRVPFGPGRNQLTAAVPGQPLTDQADIEFQLLPSQLASAAVPFTELNVSLGDERQFSDEARHQVWLPEQAYRPGGWGYVGGEVYRLPGAGRLPYGSDRNILGTDYDALYETQRVGLTQFRLDVPAGQYAVTLHFAELETAPPAEQLAYNLEKSAPTTTGPATAAGRRFDVLLNGQLVLPALGADNQLTPLQAVSFTFPVTAAAGQGIVIDFKALRGEAVLNGIQVKRLY